MFLRNCIARLVIGCILVLLHSVVVAGPDRICAMDFPLPFVPDAAVGLSGVTEFVRLGANVRYVQVDSGADAAALPQQFALTQWRVNQSSTLNFGYQTTHYWFEQDISTAKDAPVEWILEQSNSMIDEISIYLCHEGQLIDQWLIGDSFPFAQRPIQSAKFLIPLHLQADSRYQLYFRVNNAGSTELPLLLYERQTHSVMSVQRSLTDGVFHGFLLIMAAYSLALFMILRDKSYLYYVAYVITMLGFFLWQQGLLFQYGFPESPQLQHYFAPFISFFIFLAVSFFFKEFLALPERLPFIWRVCKIVVVFHGMLCLSMPFLEYHILLQWLGLDAAFAALLFATAIIRLSLRGSRSAQILLVGWAALLVFMLAFVMTKNGIFYSEFLAAYGLRMGVSFEILTFAFALAFRIIEEREQKEWALNSINLERAERIRAQELALQREIEANKAKEAALQLEIRHRESLQREVDERTKDLERTMLNLAHANRELEQLSAKDGLTSLYNRRFFDNKLNEYWQTLKAKEATLSMLLIDIDHFKQINDTRGHLCGDYVLQEFAGLLRSLVNRPCDVITRYGGEEFAVLLPETPPTGAQHLAGQIVKAAAAKLYHWNGQNIHVTVSVGVYSLIPGDADQIEALVAGADGALYQAKQTGRNRWVAA